ncbi:TY-Chap domain-containing protein [Actinoplanes flavus]|uniref:TY-Chap N-terminal domain-containing protein n=1 Tax=Actinoplanes flavus TaxID=2820290 RepID=A0ABS3UX89_9ACTN|nr:hypothetical protein [Actinoplanes flavus]MBO3743213.1 hypothetical protein [Actinoplanes flavus]
MSIESWDGLAAVIAGMAPAMVDGDTLIVDCGPYFVQMQQMEECLAVEAVGDEYLPEDRQLTGRDRQHMLELGWDPIDPVVNPNWRRPFRWPLRSGDAALVGRLFVRTLREVYGAVSPDDVTVSRFNAFGGRR